VSLTEYTLRRLLTGVGLLLALTAVTYAIFFTIPEDPGRYLVGSPHPTTAELQAADRRLGVDQPIYVQYAKFVSLLLHGDLGRSYASGEPVREIITAALPVTASIVLGGGILVMLGALTLGVYCARRAHTAVDRIVSLLPLLGIALHPLAVGLLLRWAFAKHLHLAPASGYCGLIPAQGGCAGPFRWAEHLALPWITFALFLLPLYVRMVRTRVLETLADQHITVARAKGASEQTVARAHVLPLVMPSLLAMLAMDAGGSLAAAIYIDVAYALPGLGHQALSAQQGLIGLDLPVIVGVVTVVAVMIIVLNLVADLVAVRLDPRLELGTRAATLR
jgi:peptide/nickel transport system permease protein